MKKRVWCNLPDALLERTLATLPVSSLLRFRCVCKAWNGFILSSDFLKQCTNRAYENRAYILLSTWDKEYPLLAFDPALERWHVPSLELLNDDFSLVAAAGGILCLSDGVGFVLCNPITKASRKISCQPKGHHITNTLLTNMRINEATRSFQLLVVGSTDHCRLVTYFYDSLEQAWKFGSKHDEVLFFESNGIFHGEVFFIICSFPLKLMSFDTRTASWSEAPAALPEGVQTPYLVVCCGQLILLGLVGDCHEEPVQNKLNRFQLWQLNEETQMWEELASIPESHLRKILDSEEHFEGFSCVALGNLIYMSSNHACVIYDAALKSWRWLPDSSVLSARQVCIRDVYALEPTLDSLL